MNLRQFVVIAATVLCSQLAKADLVLEPYAGYGFGNLEVDLKNGGGSSKASPQELSLGTRLGYKLPVGLWLAVDPQFALAGVIKSDTTSSTDNYSRTQVFADLGFDFSMVRAYLGYGLMNEFKTDLLKLAGGSAFKLGAALRFAQHASLFAEYRMLKYKEAANNGMTVQISDFANKYDDNSFAVGLSYMF